MAAEAGHHPNRCYFDQMGNLHLSGAQLDDAGEAAFGQKVAISAAPGAANVSLVTFQVQDGAGANLAAVFELEWWLSDAATGAGLTATTASGTVGAGASGTDLLSKVSKKAGEALTDAAGKYVLSITDTAKTGFFPCCACPGTGKTIVGPQLVAANYG